MDFDTLYNFTQSKEFDKTPEQIVEFQQFPGRMGWLNPATGTGSSVVAGGMNRASKLIDLEVVARSARKRMEQQVTSGHNSIPFPMDKIPDQIAQIYELLSTVSKEFGMAYSNNPVLTKDEKEMVHKNIKDITEIKKTLYNMLNKLGSFEK